MELRHLRYFVAVAEELNLRRAAARLHIAAPPLSVQIRQLETEIGTALFSREARRIQLTDAGRVFLEHARKLLEEAKRGINMARQAANGEIGHLSVGYTPAGFRVFPQLLPAFKKRFPQVELTFHSLTITAQLEALRRNELDIGFGFVFLPIPTEEFDVQQLVNEPVVAVLPRNHRLAASRSISIRDLSNEPLILPARSASPDAYQQIEQVFLRTGAALNVAYQLEDALSILNFVAMGAGCALLPDYLRGIHQQGVVHRPIRPPEIVDTLAMIKKKGQRGLAERFFQLAAETFPGGLATRRSPPRRRRARAREAPP